MGGRPMGGRPKGGYSVVKIVLDVNISTVHHIAVHSVVASFDYIAAPRRGSPGFTSRFVSNMSPMTTQHMYRSAVCKSLVLLGERPGSEVENTRY